MFFEMSRDLSKYFERKRDRSSIERKTKNHCDSFVSEILKIRFLTKLHQKQKTWRKKHGFWTLKMTTCRTFIRFWKWRGTNFSSGNVILSSMIATTISLVWQVLIDLFFGERDSRKLTSSALTNFFLRHHEILKLSWL